MLYPVLTNVSAFRFLCTPPVVRALAAPLPDLSTRAGKYALRSGTVFLGGIEPPVHLLATCRADIHLLKGAIIHLVSRELPFGSIRETDFDIAVTSPAMTLLSLATTLSTAQLALAMYELCGAFAVYRPTPEIRTVLQQLIDCDMLPIIDTWRPSTTASRQLTDLWRRDPLVTLDELAAFADAMTGAHGIKRFRQAMRMVHGIAASPFEAQTALLLALPRRNGGEGIGPIALNQRIVLSNEAQRIAGQTACYGDIVLPANEAHPDIVLECQSEAHHHTEHQARSDDNRQLALQSMGYTVLPLRYEQVVDPTRFESVAVSLAKLLGMPRPPKTRAQERAASELRRDIFIDWWRLGM